MTFMVCSVIALIMIVYMKTTGMINKNISLSNFPFIPLFKMLFTGIIISLITGLFFLRLKKL